MVWDKEIEKVGKVVLVAGVSIGFAAAFLGGMISSALGTHTGCTVLSADGSCAPGNVVTTITIAGNILTGIVTALSNAVSTYFPLILLAVFIGAAYVASQIITRVHKK